MRRLWFSRFRSSCLSALQGKVCISFTARRVLRRSERLAAEQAPLHCRSDGGDGGPAPRGQPIEASNLAARQRRTNRDLQHILEILDAAVKQHPRRLAVTAFAGEAV